MLRWLLRCGVIALCLAVAGCAHTVQAPLAVCPTLKTYTLAEQQEVAAALAPLPAESAIVHFIIDYGALRAQVRACRGEKP